MRWARTVTVVWFIYAAVFTFAPSSVALGGPDHGTGSDHEKVSDIPSGYRAGVLTANEGDVLEIDGVRYRLDLDLKVTDDDGNTQEPAIMRAGDKLWYTLKKGRIDRIIWIMPR